MTGVQDVTDAGFSLGVGYLEVGELHRRYATVTPYLEVGETVVFLDSFGDGRRRLLVPALHLTEAVVDDRLHLTQRVEGWGSARAGGVGGVHVGSAALWSLSGTRLLVGAGRRLLGTCTHLDVVECEFRPARILILRRRRLDHVRAAARLGHAILFRPIRTRGGLGVAPADVLEELGGGEGDGRQEEIPHA